jgi:hypothetical protein
MTKQELLNKYSNDLLSEVQFVEEQFPNRPFYEKIGMVMRYVENPVPQELAEEALKDYQHFMEI